MKYDKLLEEARANYTQGGEDACFVLCTDGGRMGRYVSGKVELLQNIIGTSMEKDEELATILLDVTSAYVKRRMVQSIQSKEAKRQAYEETTKPKS